MNYISTRGKAVPANFTTALMQGLADGYFVIPYTIGDYIAGTKLDKVTTEHAAFAEAEAKVRGEIERLKAETDQQAREELWPDYKRMRDRIGAERGWPPMQRAEFDQEATIGSLYVGSPETVARKIASTASALGIARFDLKYSAGGLSHEKLMHSIDLYGRKVIPQVRKLLTEDGAR